MMTKDKCWELIKNDDYHIDTIIAMIQLDAFKAGMSEAAEIAEQDKMVICSERIKAAILTARDKKESV